MHRIAFLLPVAIVSACVAGCATSGREVTEAQLAAFTPGTSTYGDVMAQLGKPTTMTLSSDGTRMLIYSFAHVGFMVTSVRSSAVAFYFDKDGKLVRYSTTATQTHV
jgi:outer membrane protein assembly factor BamE (lipoprotein component of BamABCDE complex)